jgi:hypothetical protein
MRACSGGIAEQDCKYGYLSRSLARCLSGQMEIIWKTGCGATSIKKPPKGYYDPVRGFTTSFSGTPTFSFYASER